MATKIIAAGGLVTNEKNELMMIYRRGKWDLPKGKLDEGESIEACAVREVTEETGVNELELVKLVGLTYHEYFDNYLKEYVIKETHWYAMHVKNNPILIPQGEEQIEKIIWADNATVDECLRNSYPNINEIIKKFRAK